MKRSPQNCRLLLLSATLGWAVPAVAIAQVAVSPAAKSATQILLEKAHTLEAKGRMDMAAQTWQQVLLADPNNTEALGGLARSAKLSGNQALSDSYLQRLRAASPNDPAIARTETLLTQSSQSAQLQQARKLAAAGNNAGAMAIYRRVFGNAPPRGEWALAYYETEAGTNDGRTNALASLRSLVERYPNDPRYTVALGRILTYNPATRVEGQKLLQQYPKDSQAADALHVSATFEADGVTRSDRKSRETPRTISTASASPQHTASAQERAAYAALNAKHFSEADTRFAALLQKKPKDIRALAGMGYVRIQQQNYAGAISFLEQAKEEGANDAMLSRSLALARFYSNLGEGAASLKEGDLTTAEAKYRSAFKMRPESKEALQGLGGTLLKAGQPQAAVSFFERASQESSDPGSWRGLVTSQSLAGDSSAALSTAQRMPAATRAQLVRDPEYLRTLATAYIATGQDEEAERVLRSALDLPFPQGSNGLKTEIELQDAGLLLQANHLEQASSMFKQMVALSPDKVLGWQGLVNTQHAMGNDVLALATLERMAPGMYEQALRDAGFSLTVAAVYQANGKYDMAQGLLDRDLALQSSSGRTPSLQLQIQLAGLLLQRNDAARALAIYRQVLNENPQRVDAWKGLLIALHAAGRDRQALAETAQIPPDARRQLATDVQYLQTMGGVYAALGDSHQALIFLNRVQQHYAAQRVSPPAGVAIQNAWLLYNAGDDAGLYRELMYLGGRPDLNDTQRRTVQTIWANWAVRRANQESAANNMTRALAILNAAAAAFPDNPTVVKALAGGYVRAGTPTAAVTIFKAQDMADESAANYKTAIGAALAAKDRKESEAWLRFALARYPQDGEILALAAKFEQAHGDSKRAAEYYKASLAALPPPAPGAELAAVLHQPASLNPSALPASSQGLAALLSPTAKSTQSQPYLPSEADADAISASYEEDGGALVPPYMSNPNWRGGSRMDDSMPGRFVPQSAGPMESWPSGGYQPPAVAMVPSERYPDVSGEAEAALAQQAVVRRVQQAQIRLANDRAALVDPTATGAGTLAGTAVFASRREGAQTGDFNGEVYGPYVPYQPPTLQGRPAISYSASLIDVPETTIVTDFPTNPGQAVSLHKVHSTGAPGGVFLAQDDAAGGADLPQSKFDPPGAAVLQANASSSDAKSGSQHNAQQYDRGVATAPTQVARPPRPGGGAASSSHDDALHGHQQYPRPKTLPVAPKRTAMRRTVRPKSVAKRVEGFGLSSPPLFYPDVPTGFQSEPYPEPPAVRNTDTEPQIGGELLARNLPLPFEASSARTAAMAGAAFGPPLTARQQIERDLAQLEAGYSGWAGGSGLVKVRSGQPGIDRLYDFEVPIEATFVAGKTARFSIVPRAVFLDSGTIDASRYTAGVVPYLGTLPANAINTPSPQFASGVGGELQVVTANLSLAAGYTPYEFLVSNVTARASYRVAGGPVTVFGEREAVKETQLSYAGLRDPGSVSPFNQGRVWGGVVASGGGLRFDHGDERSGFYVSGDGATLTGFHVLDNRRYEGTAGAYFRVQTFPRIGTLSIGAQLFAMHFAHNTRALSYGNGGYFSPELYFLGGVPVTFHGQYKARLHYTLQGSVGVHTFQENSAYLFPLDPALQAAAQAACTPVQRSSQSCSTAFLQSNTNTGANFTVDAQVAYRITDHFFAGAQLLTNNTNNYTVVQPGVFLRYTFRQQFSTEDYPTGLFPVLGFRPLRVP